MPSFGPEDSLSVLSQVSPLLRDARRRRQGGREEHGAALVHGDRGRMNGASPVPMAQVIGAAPDVPSAGMAPG